MHGHWGFPPFDNATAAAPACAPGACAPPFDWALDLPAALDAVAARLRPTALLLNSGGWASTNAWDAARWEAVGAAADRATAAGGGTMYWKTTTGASEFVGRNRSHDATAIRVAGERGWRVYDAFGPTAELGAWLPSPMVDNQHFEVWVYNELNHLLLNLLCQGRG